MLNTEEINKPGWKPKFMAEYSMGEYDYARIDKTLSKVDELSAIVNSTAIPDLPMMQQFFAQLNNLADNFKPIIAVATVTDEINTIIGKCKAYKRIWEKSQKNGLPINDVTILQFVDILNALKTKLYSIKQVIGLGIVVKRNLTTAQKIKRGVRGHGDLGNLPVA